MITASLQPAARASGGCSGLPLIWGNNSVALLATGQVHLSVVSSWYAIQALSLGFVPAMYLLTWGHDEVYTVLWAVVFGFATINILSLGARSFEHGRSGLNFGEILAIMVVVVSVILLAGEMLYYFGILPIRLQPR